MDYILTLSKTRWRNRKVVKQPNQIFNQLNVKQHPDKTYIGNIAKGVYFLAYHFSNKPITLAAITIRKHIDRIIRLYEQQIKKKTTSNEVVLVLGIYSKSWQCCCTERLYYACILRRKPRNPNRAGASIKAAAGRGTSLTPLSVPLIVSLA